MKVSVIIPTYNRRVWLQEAIDSVLAQRGVEFECIVVDDGSTDGTGEVLAQRYGNRIRYVWQDNQGESVARNHGAELANGEYLAFLDSDDLWMPEKLAEQTTFLDSNSAFAAVYCQAWRIDKNKKRLPGKPNGYLLTNFDFNLTYLLEKNLPLSGSTVMIRRQVFKAIGGYDREVRFGEDLEFALLLAVKGYRLGIVQRPLASIRTHFSSQSIGISENQFLEVLKDHTLLLNKVGHHIPLNDSGTRTALQNAIGREYMRMVYFYIFNHNSRDVEEYRQKIIQTSPQLLESAQEYERILWLMLPMLNNLFTGQKQISEFCKNIFNFRNRSIQADHVEAALTSVRANVWYTITTNGKIPLEFWEMIWSQIKERPIILVMPRFWKQLLKIILMRLPVKFNGI